MKTPKEWLEILYEAENLLESDIAEIQADALDGLAGFISGEMLEDEVAMAKASENTEWERKDYLEGHYAGLLTVMGKVRELLQPKK